MSFFLAESKFEEKKFLRMTAAPILACGFLPPPSLYWTIYGLYVDGYGK